MQTQLRGVVHGLRIDLQDDPGLPDGEEIVITIVNSNRLTDEERRECLRRSAGGWANDDPEGLEEYLKWNRAQRKLSRGEASE